MTSNWFLSVSEEGSQTPDVGVNICVFSGVFAGQSRRFPQFLQSTQDPAEEPGDGEAGGADCYPLRHPEGVPCCQIPRVSTRGRSGDILTFHFHISQFFQLNVDAAARTVTCDLLSLNTAFSQVRQCA